MVHTHMKKIGVRPDGAAAEAIVAAHVAGGDDRGAEELFSQFSKLGIMQSPRPTTNFMATPYSNFSSSSLPRSLPPKSDTVSSDVFSEGAQSLPISEQFDSETEQLV